ncbi:MAG TPA: helix-turn-helix transcriptional regulator [Candidatus Angelobacter sp.]
MRSDPPTKMYPVRHACKVLGVSYPALKQWIYKGKIKTVKTPGGHHRIPESEIDRLLPAIPQRGPVQKRRETFRTISGRNQLVGRVVELKIEGLMAQVTLSIAGQRLTSIITADAVREMRLEKGQLAAALVKSTDVMVMRVK